jgi:two-component system cell cycle sensor histidine kinase/response regulator CckA
LKGVADQVLEAASADEAREVSRRFPDPICLLITDVDMPGVDGLALAEALITERTGIKILITSGIPRHQEALQHSQWPFLAKPFTREQLRAAVAGAIAKRG